MYISLSILCCTYTHTSLSLSVSMILFIYIYTYIYIYIYREREREGGREGERKRERDLPPSLPRCLAPSLPLPFPEPVPLTQFDRTRPRARDLTHSLADQRCGQLRSPPFPMRRKEERISAVPNWHACGLESDERVWGGRGGGPGGGRARARRGGPESCSARARAHFRHFSIRRDSRRRDSRDRSAEPHALHRGTAEAHPIKTQSRRIATHRTEEVRPRRFPHSAICGEKATRRRSLSRRGIRGESWSCSDAEARTRVCSRGLRRRLLVSGPAHPMKPRRCL